ncbi:DNA-binding winged helix-turn-helix (wHTH) protein [Klebsiella oxytoca]|uniref:DNA-binding winged helix-turn-helix (WHTH) protein n=1 Tax=Klebsiella oxytoca TaxID=571 RepID=A0A318FM99_KLEOX|nr:winged helix-turn-helix domain-containing protein [Klebsiella oxytoca]PXW44437.1 DNA-binding winged helix-turn-helix (wHTH) protein [Klebsiella oxytoca]HCB1500661.1 winged helix-turn-helix domain-containing protein [Klebsiella michiganensis]HCB1846826.1 winged helix-turn-helix domain-containing protein [Klebsiella oxytoca]
MVFNEYIINNEVIFNTNVNKLQPLGESGDSVTLNAPTARCLQLLLESNGKVISREEFLDMVWKTRGVVVSQNTFYQNISLLRKSLLKAGLSQDIIVTVRQRGFVLASDSSIAFFSRDEGEEDSAKAKNVQVISSTAPPQIERKMVDNSCMSPDLKINYNDNKHSSLSLPCWLPILLIALIVTNILSLML